MVAFLVGVLFLEEVACLGLEKLGLYTVLLERFELPVL
jgi:hypothetical protein